MIRSRRMRRMNESTNRNYKLIPSSRAENLDSTIYDILAYDYDLAIIPKSDDFPMPCDMRNLSPFLLL